MTTGTKTEGIGMALQDERDTTVGRLIDYAANEIPEGCVITMRFTPDGTTLSFGGVGVEGDTSCESDDLVEQFSAAVRALWDLANEQDDGGGNE